VRFRGNLQLRFLLASVVLVAVLCAAFALVVHEFIELLEDEMLHWTSVPQMRQFKLDLANDPRHRPPAVRIERLHLAHCPRSSRSAARHRDITERIS
jgi:hypothetical protein